MKATKQQHLLTVAKTFGNTEQATFQVYFYDGDDLTALLEEVYSALDERQAVTEKRMKVIEDKLREQAKREAQDLKKEARINNGKN